MTPVEDSAPGLQCDVVPRVREDACDVHSGHQVLETRSAPTVPTPRTERVLPGHLVAVATDAAGRPAVVWRWFDAVVLGPDQTGLVRLWEPAHGEVVARLRDPAQHLRPGSRVYASSGLPGAGWWAAGRVGSAPEEADVELGALRAFYAEHGLWARAFDGQLGPRPSDAEHDDGHASTTALR